MIGAVTSAQIVLLVTVHEVIEENPPEHVVQFLHVIWPVTFWNVPELHAVETPKAQLVPIEHICCPVRCDADALVGVEKCPTATVKQDDTFPGE